MKVLFWSSLSLEVGYMNRVLNFLLSAMLMCVLSCSVVWAQSSTAQINGTVKDQSGAVLPGADVTATQIATGAKRSAVTKPDPTR